MRVPKQTPDVDRKPTMPQVGAAGVVPAGILDVLKNVGISALKGALGGVASGI